VRRFITIVFVLAMAGLGTTLPVLASSTLSASSPDGRVSDRATPVPASERPPDLAAMVLIPSDLPQSGFGLEASDTYGLDSYDAPTLPSLRDAGYVTGYESSLVLAPSGKIAMRVQTALDELTDANGAEIGFSVFTNGNDPAIEEVEGTHTIGDDSYLSRKHEHATDVDQDYDLLTLVFREGPIVATIYTQDWTGKQPEIAATEALGDALDARVQAGLHGQTPGLGTRIVRLDLPRSYTSDDVYRRLDGQDISNWDDTPEIIASRKASYLNAIDFYTTDQMTSTSDAPTWVSWRLGRFPSAADASTWLKAYLPYVENDPTQPWTVTPMSGAPSYGDESRTFTYTYQTSDGTIAGAAVLARFGAIGVIVRIQNYQDAIPLPVNAVEELIQEETNCIDASAPCRPQPVPDNITA
jgi:hypothetical protein